MSESIEYKGYTIKIEDDQFIENPLEWDEPYGMLVCFHGRYQLGHFKHSDNIWSMTNDMDEFREWLNENKNDIISLPLYLYDHSGITIQTTPFSCPWDSGQVGETFITKEKVRKIFGVKRISPKLKEKVLECLRNEVKTYDQYLRGEVYGYTVKDKDNEDEEIGSCWGYFGYDHEQSGLIESAKESIDAEIEKIGEQTVLELVS